MSYERKIIFQPAFDRRNEDPKKNYGVHGVDMCFLLTGDKGVIQFVLMTNWQLPHVQREWESRPTPASLLRPLPADLGYHALEPKYEGQSSTGACEFLNGRPCYYDGSTLNAEPVFDLLVREGDEAVWKYMEAYYESTFNRSEEPVTA